MCLLPPYIFSNEVSVQAFCHFFYWVICDFWWVFFFFLVFCFVLFCFVSLRVFNVFQMQVLYQIYALQVFLPIVGFVFSLSEQYLLKRSVYILWTSIQPFVLLWVMLLLLYLRNLCLTQAHKDFSSVSFQKSYSFRFPIQTYDGNIFSFSLVKKINVTVH